MRYATCLFLLVISMAYAEERRTGVQVPVRPIDCEEGVVVQVIDGDTLALRDGRQVRLIGVDCPPRYSRDARRKELGERALFCTKRLVEHKRVGIEYDEERKDKYGRTLAYVWVGEALLNTELVRAGLAEVEPHPPNLRHHEHLLALQRMARQRGLGLWAGRSAPSDSRRSSPGEPQLGYRVVSKGVSCNVVLGAAGEPLPAELMAVAEKVWGTMKNEYDDVLVFVWLPDQEIGAGLPYAVANFTNKGLSEFKLHERDYRLAHKLERAEQAKPKKPGVSREPGPSRPRPSKPQRVVRQGEWVDVGKLSCFVHAAQWCQALTTRAYLEKGPTDCLVVDLSLRNGGTEPRPCGRLVLVDSYEREHSSARDTYYLDDRFDTFDPLNPGMVRRGVVAFEVPENLSYRLAVSDGYGSRDAAYVQLRPVFKPGPFEVQYVGDRQKKRYHLPLCPRVAKINVRYRAFFDTVREARDAGLSACKDCRPPRE